MSNTLEELEPLLEEAGAGEAQVGIVIGSESDREIMQAAADELDKLEIPYEISVISAHRDHKKLVQYAETAAGRGLKVVIAGAGMAAALPGVIASLTSLPVIGVPIHTGDLGGLDSLLAIAQMPPGVPVACMAINGAKNAAIMAGKILAV